MICLFHLLFVAADSQFSTAQVSIVYVCTNSDLNVMLHCVTSCICLHCHDFSIKQSHCVVLCYIVLHRALCIYTQCHVFIQENGERSILMAPAATSQINAAAVQNHFGNGFAYASHIPRSSHRPLFDHIQWRAWLPMYLPQICMGV